MKLLNQNSLALLVILLVISLAIWQYQLASDKVDTFDQLYSQISHTDLPLHRLRSSDSENSPDPYKNLREDLRREDFTASLAEIRNLIATEPENVNLHYYAGGIAERLGDWTAAEKYYQTVRMNSNLLYEDALKKLTLIYYRQDLLAKCQTAIDDLRNLDKEANQAWLLKVHSLLK